MDAYVAGSECFSNLDGTPVRVEVFEPIDNLFDPDEIGKGNRVACTPLKSGSYHGVLSVILYASAGKKCLCITVIDHKDGDQKKCKLKELWEVDEDNGRLEIDAAEI